MSRLLENRLCRIVLVALLLVLVCQSLAVACPTCKDTLAANDPARQNIVRGYFYSILFMLSMPFLILTGLSSYFYYEVRKARRLKAATSVPQLLSATQTRHAAAG
jgi:hypothetical protein